MRGWFAVAVVTALRLLVLVLLCTSGCASDVCGSTTVDWTTLLSEIRSRCKADCKHTLMTVRPETVTFERRSFDEEFAACENGCDHFDVTDGEECFTLCKKNGSTCAGCLAAQLIFRSCLHRALESIRLAYNDGTDPKNLQLQWTMDEPKMGKDLKWTLERRIVSWNSVSPWTVLERSVERSENMYRAMLSEEDFTLRHISEIRLSFLHRNKFLAHSLSLLPSTNYSADQLKLYGPDGIVVIAVSTIAYVIWVPFGTGRAVYTLTLYEGEDSSTPLKKTVPTAHFVFTGLKCNHRYRIEVSIDVDSSLALPALKSSFLASSVCEDSSNFGLVVASTTHVIILPDKDDFLVHDPPEIVFAVKSGKISALAAGRRYMLIVLDDGRAFLRLKDNNAVTELELGIKLPQHVKAVAYDPSADRLFVGHENKISTGSIWSTQMDIVIETGSAVVDLAADFTNGFLYYSMGNSIFRIGLNATNERPLKLNISFLQDTTLTTAIHLAVDQSSQNLVFNVNSRLFAFQLMSSYVEEIRGNNVRGNAHTYLSAVKLVSWRGRVYGVSAPCSADVDSCLFSEEVNPQDRSISVNSYVLPPHYRPLMSCGLEVEDTQYVVIPPPGNFSAIFSASSVRLAWNAPYRLPFQAANEWRNISYEVELLSSGRTVLQKRNIFEPEHIQRNLEPKTRYVAKVRACVYGVCSRWTLSEGVTQSIDALRNTEHLLLATETSLLSVDSLGRFKTIAFHAIPHGDRRNTAVLQLNNSVVSVNPNMNELIRWTHSNLRFKPRCFDYDPYGGELYWCTDVGVFRQAEDGSSDRLHVSSDGTIRWLKVLSSAGILVVANEVDVYALYLTGSPYRSYYTCQGKNNCEILSLAVDTGSMPAVLYYFVSVDEGVQLFSHHHDGGGRRLRHSFANALWLDQVPALKTRFVRQKLIILTAKRRLISFDIENDLLAEYAVPEANDFTVFTDFVSVPEATKCCLSVKLKKNRQNSGIVLSWAGVDQLRDTLLVDGLSVYNVTIVQDADASHVQKVVFSTFTTKTRLTFEPDSLPPKFVAHITQCGISRRVATWKAFERPTFLPSAPANLRALVTHQKTAYNTTANVYLTWDEPSWNGDPRSYRFMCWKSEAGSKKPLLQDVEKEAHVTFFILKNVPIRDSLFCQVSAVNFPEGEGAPAIVRVDTSEVSPLQWILFGDNERVGVFNTRSNRTLCSATIGHVKAVSFGHSAIYAIHKDKDGDWLNVIDAGSFHVVQKVTLTKWFVRVSSISWDWVGERLFMAGKEWKNAQTQGDSVSSWSLKSDEPPQVQYSTLPGHQILTLRYDPFESKVYFILSFGRKFALKSFDVQRQTVETYPCELAASCFALTYAAAAVQPVAEVIFLAPSGISETKQCSTLVADQLLDGSEGKNMQQIAADRSVVYVASKTVYVIDRSDLRVAALNLSNVNDIVVYGLENQPVPDLQCLQLPGTPAAFNFSFISNTSFVLTVEPSQPDGNTCGSIAPPPAHFAALLSPSDVGGHCDHRCIKKESRSPSIFFDNVPSSVYYQLTVGWSNTYTKPIYTEKASSVLAGSILVPTLQVQPAVVTPGQVFLLWKPVCSQQCQVEDCEFEITGISNRNGSFTKRTHCSTLQCADSLTGLVPSTRYSFRVSQLCREWRVDAARVKQTTEETSVFTFDVPGRMSNAVWDAGHRVFTFDFELRDRNRVKDVVFQYRKTTDDPWKTAELVATDGMLLTYRVDVAVPSTDRYFLRLKATYHLDTMLATKVGQNTIEYLMDFPHWGLNVPNVSPVVQLAVVEKSSGRFLSWPLEEIWASHSIVSLIIKHRTNDLQENWTTMADHVSPNPPEWRIPDNVDVSLQSEFEIDAVTSQGELLSFGYWKNSNRPSGLSAFSVAAIILVLTLVFMSVVFAVVYFVLRRRTQLKPRKISAVVFPEKRPVDLPVLELSSFFSAEELRGLPHVPRDCISLVRVLGQGAFGEVYEGVAYKLPGTGEKAAPVAVKTLRCDSTDADRLKFLREAVRMSKFNHVNIVKLLGVCMETNPQWLILELMDGGDLLKYLRSVRATEMIPSQVSIKDLLSIAVDVASGCSYLESIHHVHRDIAARNCLITTRNPQLRQVKIADFGLTRDIYEEDYYRAEKHGLVPVRWMAPESIIDGVFTTKTDVWSFGVLLWEVITLGQQPYSNKTNWEVLNFVRLGGRLDQPEYCPPEMYKLMNDCWSFAPAERPTFQNVLEALQQLAASQSFHDDSPFPPFFELSIKSNNANNAESYAASVSSNRDSQAPISSTASSIRFSRNKDRRSSTGVSSKRGIALFRSLKRQPSGPHAQPPSKEDIKFSTPGVSAIDSQGNRISGLSTGTVPPDLYEVPLLQSLQSASRGKSFVGVNNFAYQDTSPDNTDASFSQRTSSRYSPIS